MASPCRPVWASSGHGGCVSSVNVPKEQGGKCEALNLRIQPQKLAGDFCREAEGSRGDHRSYHSGEGMLKLHKGADKWQIKLQPLLRSTTCLNAAYQRGLLRGNIRGAPQSVDCLTSAQVVISRFMSSSPTLDSVLTAQSLEPASDSVSPSLSAPPLLMLCLSLCVSVSKVK